MHHNHFLKHDIVFIAITNFQRIYMLFCTAMRQKGRFAGFSVYVSNSTDMPSGVLCYKDGPELPPLNFNTNCTKHGRYVIFYNERLVGTKYPVEYVTTNVITQLCEVIVTGIVFKINYYQIVVKTKFVYRGSGLFEQC